MNPSSTRLKKFLIAPIAAALGGCASMGGKQRQSVLIQSDPPGAEIQVDGKAVGQTPQYVLVERSSRPEVHLLSEGKKQTVELKSNYRWNKSFFSNMIWLTYAPAGWLVDFATGAAWDVEDSPVVSLHLHKDPRAKKGQTPHDPTISTKPITTIAIAPPLADSGALSDAGGIALEASLRNSPAVRANGWTIRPFNETRSIFLANHYDYDGAPDQRDLRDAFYDLKADAIYHSRIELRNDRLVLHAKLENVLTRKAETPLELEFTPENRIETIYTRQRHLVQWLPNTIGIDRVEDRLVWNFQNGKQVDLAAVPSDHWSKTAFQYVSAVSLSNQPARREGRAARGVFSFVPALRVSHRTAQPRGYPELQGQTYERWWVSAGYGPEFGWQFSRNYIYLNFIPHLYWNEISWTRNGLDEVVSNGGVTAQLEVGYLFQYDNNWSFKFFTRNVGEDSTAWKEALRKSTANTQEFQGATSITAGISIGYSFEPTLNQNRWIRKAVR